MVVELSTSVFGDYGAPGVIQTPDALLRILVRVGGLIDFTAQVATEKHVQTCLGHSSGTEVTFVLRPLARY